MSKVTQFSSDTPIKAAPRFWDQEQLKVFNLDEHQFLIKELARGLDPDEVLSYLGVDYDMLPQYDKWFFNTTFNRGRIDQKHAAVLSLVNSMSGKTALQSSLAYLLRFGNDTWKKDVNAVGPAVPATVKLIIDDGTQSSQAVN